MVNRVELVLTSVLVSVLLIGGCDETPTASEPQVAYELVAPRDPSPRGERLFGVTVVESERGFGPSFQTVQEAGTRLVSLNIPWNIIEVAEGEFEDPWGVLGAISFYGQRDVQVLFSLAVINTVESTAPAYLQGLAWDAPEMIAAFNRMIDWFLANVPENVTVPGLAIGNEIDLFLSEGQWDAYTRFFQATSEHVRARYPDLEIGVKTTVMAGALGRWASRVEDINQYADVVMLNYYPQGSDFRVLAPEVVSDHFDKLSRQFQGRSIWLTEVGYQSGSKHCGSSETKQAHFYHHLFTAWDRHRDQIGLVLVDWLHDQSPEKIAEFAQYYGLSSPGFVEYLSTLGLRRHDHTDKPAWPQVVAEAKARGW